MSSPFCRGVLSIGSHSSRWFMQPTGTRFKSTSLPSCDFGIAFDIDGVLVRGGKELPRAREMLLSLQERNVPHIFLTNGGGCLEAQKAETLSKQLDVKIDPMQMVVSHSPMRALVEKYKDSRVLIMGSYDVYTVARSYGFNKVVSINDLAHHHPVQYPYHHYEEKAAPFHNEPIEAILIMHDPINWAPELQIAVDVLIGGNPPGISRSCGTQTPLYVSNDDFVFSGAYPVPRFAQGAFTQCLQLLYEKRTGRSLEVTRYGKPHNVTYQYAESLLSTIANRPLKRIYGIGDNPDADIRGANDAGSHWTSILVKTGIYDGTSPLEHSPDVHVHSVYEGIQHIYHIEQME